MSNDTWTDRQDQRSALDAFAAMSGGDQLPVPTGSNLTAISTIHGAQSVAVRRDERVVLARLKALAAAAGTEFMYRFPVKNRKTGETSWISGPTIKLANDVARVYGNCEIDIRVTDLGDNWLFYARFIDLETGYSLTRPFQQRKQASRLGGDDDARRLDIAFQIGASKAIRNVVVNALQTFADYAFEEAENALVDKIGKDLGIWRDRAVTRISEHVDLVRVERVIGRKFSDWLAPDVARVIAMMRSVQDGMASLDETFPPLEADKPAAAPASSQLDRFVAEGDKPPAEAAPKKRGRPSKAESEARKAAEKPQDDENAQPASEATPAPESAPEPAQGIASGFQREAEAAVDAEDRQPSAQYVAESIIREMDAARSMPEVDSITARYRPIVKTLAAADDRMDCSAILYAYQQFAAQQMSEVELEREIAMRRELIGKR